MNARELRRWRREQYLSMQALANLLDVHVNTISNWEHNVFPVPHIAELAMEAITQARAMQVRKMRLAKEELAHKRRLKMIEQGLKDEVPA